MKGRTVGCFYSKFYIICFIIHQESHLERMKRQLCDLILNGYSSATGKLQLLRIYFLFYLQEWLVTAALTLCHCKGTGVYTTVIH